MLVDTPRLQIRNFVCEDWQKLKDLIVWYMSSPYAAFDHPWPTSDDEIQGICEWFTSSDEYLAVCLQENGQFIGYLSLSPSPESKVFHIGYCFEHAHHGKGYALEGCNVLIDYAVTYLGAEVIAAGTAADNIPSCRLLEKLGMTLVNSAPCSFRNDADGNPIVFTGNEYELRYIRL